jgi:hypothetical protein
MDQIVVHNKFTVTYKLGQGSFGVLYVGKNRQTEEQVAMKMEPIIC